VILCCCTQIAKTTVLGNAIAYYSDVQPSPMLFVGPTLAFSESYSKEKLQQMIDASPRLRGLYGKRKSRDPDQTIMLKRFPGGFLALAGSNAPAGMSGRSIRVAICDEVDRFTSDAGEEGDPLGLIEERLTAFWDAKFVKASTPTIKGLSKIEADFLRSDRRYLFVPCPHCEWRQRLVWRDEQNRFRLIWERDSRGAAVPGSERYVCIECGCEIEESAKPAMLDAGEWRPTAIGEPGVRGYHLNQLYNPWSRWANMRSKWERAQGDPRKLQVFINTQLAETYEEDSSSAPDMADHREAYPAEVPRGVGVLTAAVDTQDTWLEVKVKGWGAGQESWLVHHQQIDGDPNTDAPWLELDQVLLRPFVHETGAKLYIQSATVDSGGHKTEAVYRFCKARLAQGRRVFPIRGASASQSSRSGGLHREFVGLPTRNNAYRVPLYTLNVDTGKDIVFGRMRQHTRGPGYMHLPEWVEEEYLEQLCKAEKAVRKTVKGRFQRVYVPLRDRREALDLEVYNLAALYLLGPRVMETLGEIAEGHSAETHQSAVPTPRGRRMRSQGIG
jgi:phage terminase large subunit GpA-like protein